jgi:hypothetical protein
VPKNPTIFSGQNFGYHEIIEEGIDYSMSNSKNTMQKHFQQVVGMKPRRVKLGFDLAPFFIPALYQSQEIISYLSA